jgi:hypothetical protein
MAVVGERRAIWFPNQPCGEACLDGRTQMKLIGIGVLLEASLCFAQDSSDFKPATSNVLDAQYPKVDGNSRVQSTDAIKVKLNFWSVRDMDGRNSQG